MMDHTRDGMGRVLTGDPGDEMDAEMRVRMEQIIALEGERDDLAAKLAAICRAFDDFAYQDAAGEAMGYATDHEAWLYRLSRVADGVYDHPAVECMRAAFVAQEAYARLREMRDGDPERDWAQYTLAAQDCDDKHAEFLAAREKATR